MSINELVFTEARPDFLSIETDHVWLHRYPSHAVLSTITENLCFPAVVNLTHCSPSYVTYSNGFFSTDPLGIFTHSSLFALGTVIIAVFVSRSKVRK